MNTRRTPPQTGAIIPVARPDLSGRETEYVNDCMATEWISSRGDYIGRFSDAFAATIGAPFALPCSSGTTALQLALHGLGIGPGDEVILPDLTFGACANAVIHSGAAPVFADIDRDSWILDPDAAAAAITSRTKAIMPVHLYGHPCDMDAIMALAERHDLFVIEDCAEAIGGAYRNRPVGTIGHVGCFSFFANKTLTTGEGGMVTTAERSLFERMAVLRDHGMAPDRRYWHETVGFNFRMTNIQAAIGLAQVERQETMIARRKAVAAQYDRELGGIDGITPQYFQEWADSMPWLYSVLVDPDRFGMDRDSLGAALKTTGVETRPLFYTVQDQPAFKAYARTAAPNAAFVSEHGISLPTGNVTKEEVMVVCDAIRALARRGTS